MLPANTDLYIVPTLCKYVFSSMNEMAQLFAQGHIRY